MEKLTSVQQFVQSILDITDKSKQNNGFAGFHGDELKIDKCICKVPSKSFGAFHQHSSTRTASKLFDSTVQQYR